jgi:uncharacterized protein (DUF1810 family)
MTHQYGLERLEEARTYRQHAALGQHLAECCDALLSIGARFANDVFGSPDDLKLCSRRTLFKRAVPDKPGFELLLEKYFLGIEDAKPSG